MPDGPNLGLPGPGVSLGMDEREYEVLLRMAFVWCLLLSGLLLAMLWRCRTKPGLIRVSDPEAAHTLLARRSPSS